MAHGVATYELSNIAAAVSELNLGGNEPFLDGEFSGGECRIFKLSFADHASVAVRVRHASHDISHDNHIAMVQDEVQIPQKLEERGFPWAPKCLGASLTFDNPIKSPFSVSAWIDGIPLRWDEDFPAQSLRDKVLGRVASIQLSLMTCTLETPFIDGVLGEDGDSKAFAMNHGDLKASNIIVDEQYNIKGQTYIDSYSSQTSLAALAMMRWQGAGAVDFRILYLTSISSKGVHKAMAQAGWKLSYCESAGDAEAGNALRTEGET
ncbi:hypothetical protein CCMA1212_001423 [Trichoderma ghanense]|uniref:Aminoglycoside phosphotransferase domain-containing protein n=1 Tax=Trichoderma ghanense TaxID=65468 RepID=A0ABY2HER3_9HYPO